ncbi:MAG: STAS domain-containing protein [Spirochaetales bacterium]|nr:STAS domain-containing protein [Spirochaetales bacterium]
MNMPYFNKFNSLNFDTKITCQYINEDNTQVSINFSGDMETFYTKFFRMAVLNLFDNEAGIDTLFFDFDKVNYVASSFIASLLQIINKAKQIDINIFFINLNIHTKQMVDSLGLGHFVKEIDKKLKDSLKIICRKCKKNVFVKKLGEFVCPFCNTLLFISNKGVVK